MPFSAIAAAAAPFLAQGLNMFGNAMGARRQEAANMRIAKFQHDRNWDMYMTDRAYNTPLAQRQRFEAAGLNPALMYGQGTPGNVSAPQYPNIQAPNLQAIYADLGSKMQESLLMKSQTDLTNQKVTESGVKQDLMKQQKALIAANPYLNEAYVKSMVTNMEAVATLKQNERNYMVQYPSATDKPGEMNNGQIKMMNDIKLLEAKFNLANADKQIKAKIIESKGFQNELQRIQTEWMKNGEITPQHIYMGIMMILQKLM